MPELNPRFEEFIRALRLSEAQRNAAKDELDFLESKLGGFISDDDEDFIFVKGLRSGSYAKKTILKRHESGDFDADIGIYLKSESGKEIQTDDAISYIKKLLDRAYQGRTTRQPKFNMSKKSSIKVIFEGHPKINLDVVSIEAKEHLSISNWGEILRSDGSRRETSISEHIAFVSDRNKESGSTPFNQLIMLWKWWRNHQFSEEEQEKVSSFFIEVYVGKAFDEVKSQFTDNWVENLQKLCLWMVRHRLNDMVAFKDSRIETPSSFPADPVVVLDPINQSNNIAHDWTVNDKDSFIKRVEEFNEILTDALMADEDDDLDAEMDALDGIFPNFSDWSE